MEQCLKVANRRWQSTYLLEQKNVIPPNTNSVHADCVIIDAMAVLHSLTSIPATWGELSRAIFNRAVLAHFRMGVERADFVSDVYIKDSIKGCEHQRRSEIGSDCEALRVKISAGEQKTPFTRSNWIRYIGDGENKMDLIRFLSLDWSTEAYQSQILGETLFISNRKEYFLISNFAVNPMPRLYCCHEEADTHHSAHRSCLPQWIRKHSCLFSRF